MPYKDPNKQKEYKKRHYLNNKSQTRQRTINARRRNKEYVDSVKTECVKCGCKEKFCLDFHHLKDKFKSVSRLVRGATSIENIKKEIDKCEILCGNCHRKEHSPILLQDGSSWKNFNEARIQKRKWFISYVDKLGCIECGENDNRCLEFHHLKDKLFEVSYLLTSGHSLDFLKKEIDKCEILCTNCHRKKHTW